VRDWPLRFDSIARQAVISVAVIHRDSVFPGQLQRVRPCGFFHTIIAAIMPVNLAVQIHVMPKLMKKDRHDFAVRQKQFNGDVIGLRVGVLIIPRSRRLQIAPAMADGRNLSKAPQQADERRTQVKEHGNQAHNEIAQLFVLNAQPIEKFEDCVNPRAIQAAKPSINGSPRLGGSFGQERDELAALPAHRLANGERLGDVRRFDRLVVFFTIGFVDHDPVQHDTHPSMA